jgi:N-acetylneuraminic acid mutarotase
MNTLPFRIYCVILLGLIVNLQAQVPSVLNYQGRIAVGGVNFTGAGLFKFALIDGAGSQSYWSNDGSSIAGSQPSLAVSIDVESGIYSVRLGDTTLPNMTAVPATVFANGDVRLRVWFNDGTNGWQQMSPDQRIAAVGYAMMANTVQDGAITSAKIATGAVGASQLATGAVGSNQLAAGAAAANLNASSLSAVAAGGIIGSQDASSAALLAQGFVRDPNSFSTEDSWATLAAGDAVAGHTAVWTGTELITWGGVVPTGSSDPAGTVRAINRGMRFNPATQAWTPISVTGAPQGRFGHTAVWTGTEMIVFGGQTTDVNGTMATVLNNGGRYNPTTDTWSYLTPLVNSNPTPIADNRRGHLAFWTGSKMLIWGGRNATQPFGMSSGGAVNSEGRIYDPAANTWSNMAQVPPEMTVGDTWVGVWSGTQMILWSRQSGSAMPPSAGRYDPVTNTWQTLASIPGDPMLPDSGISAVWSGTEMILWGGSMAAITPTNAGYRYNPTTNAWTTMTTAGAPAARSQHGAAWIGSEMVVWGGSGQSVVPPGVLQFSNGGRYNPGTDTWTTLSSSSAPTPRQMFTATAADSQLIVWGGVQTSQPSTIFKFLKNGGSLTPANDTWSYLAHGSPAPRAGHTMIWTGTEMIVWGGTISNGLSTGIDPTFNDGARFNPATGVWTPLPITNAPAGRYGHGSVWTGTEMIVWGGQGYDTAGGPVPQIMLNSGARYNPTTNLWTPTSTTNAPTARSRHSAVWTGSKMIVWGGTSDGVAMNVSTGALYDPVAGSWTATSDIGAPQATSNHLAFWTGSEMLIQAGGPGGPMASNARYNPGTNSWTSNAVNPNGFPFDMSGTAAVWTGSEVLVGFSGAPSFSLYGYSPVADFWQALPGLAAFTSTSPVSIWTGSEMIVWGIDAVPLSTTSQAARFNPATGTWTSITTTGGPTVQMGGAVWTGSEMLMWGGRLGVAGFSTTSINDIGFSYRLPQNYYLYRRP